MSDRAARSPIGTLAVTLITVLAATLGVAVPPASAAGPSPAPGAGSTSTDGDRDGSTATHPVLATVLIASVTPRVARPGDAVTLTGWVRAGHDPLPDVHLRVWLRQTVGARVQVESALTATLPQGSLRSDVALASTLPADGRARFSVVLPATEVSGGGDVAVRLVGLQVRARVAGTATQVGLRTVPLPFAPATDVPRATRLAVVVPMTSAPRRTAGDVFLDDALAAEVAPGGRLRRLLAASAGWTLAVDPALVEDLAVMASAAGYDVAAATGPPVHHPTSVDARTLLHALQQRARVQNAVTLLPYADVAVGGLVHARAAGDVGRAVRLARTEAASLLGTNLQVEALLPPAADQPVATATATAWRKESGTPIVLPDAEVAEAEPPNATPDAAVTLSWPGGARSPGLVVDASVSAEVAGAGPDNAGDLQQLLGELAMHTAELPGRPRGLLAVLPRDWNPTPSYVAALHRALGEAAWVEPTAFADLLTAAEQGTARTVVPAEPKTAPPRLALGVQRVRRHVAAGHAFAQVLAAASAGRELATAYDHEGLRLESLHGSDAGALLALSSRQLQAREDSIRLVVNRLITLPASRSFPLTIRNTGSETVQVAVAFSRSLRVQVRRTPLVTVEPDRAVRVEVATSPGANGRALLTAYLVSPSGQQIGQPATLRLSIRGAGAPARVVVSVAVAVFVLALGLRLLRRHRRPRPPRPGTGPDASAHHSQEVPA